VTQERQYKIIDKQALDIGMIQAAAHEAWSDMHIPGSASHANAQAHGLSSSEFPRSLKQVLRICPACAGIASVDMVVTALLGKAAWDMWKYVVMPYIESRWGVGVIREKLAADKRVAAARGKNVPKRTVAKKSVRRR
jgi:hypothetical protein